MDAELLSPRYARTFSLYTSFRAMRINAFSIHSQLRKTLFC